MQSQKTTKKIGYLTWQHGFLVYSQITPPAANLCWNSKNWVANASLEQAIKFVAYVNFIELPKNTSITKVRKLYHNFTMHNLLKENGIDMFPVDRPEPQYYIKAKLLYLVKAVYNWFTRLRAAF